MKITEHFLSVIIPIYKQEKTILTDITNIQKTLDQIRYDYEIIAVVDGKNIDRSYQILKKAKIPKVKIYGYPNNYGKGYAVRFGMAKTKGDYVAFIDAGMEIDPNGISMILEHMEWYNADIIVASKRHPASQVKYPLDRQIVSFGAHLIARFLLGINVHDTQAGLKIFKRSVLVKVLPRLLVKNYAFDLEILSVSNRLGFNRIFEAPIKLSYAFDSLTHAGSYKTIIRCFIESLAVFYRLNIIKFYDDNNKRQWVFNKDLQMRINTGR
ncbi:MAG: glycosyltransferase [Candidatus Shapirobacteria bacterium]|jgi:glycosyltransferase involved in cell wall biosynthesis